MVTFTPAKLADTMIRTLFFFFLEGWLLNIYQHTTDQKNHPETSGPIWLVPQKPESPKTNPKEREFKKKSPYRIWISII